MILFQNISLKITDISFQNATNPLSYLNLPKTPSTLVDFFLILLILFFFYYIIFEFLNLTYEKYITFSNTKTFFSGTPNSTAFFAIKTDGATIADI